MSFKSIIPKFTGLVILISGATIAGFAIAFGFAETPVFSLPVHELGVVSGVQVFHDNRSTQLHIGFDFRLENNTEIFSPIAGKITQVKKHQMSNGYWIIDVNIKINSKWTMFIAFEPWTTEELVIDEQMLFISVNTGDTVELNQSLGILTPVPSSEFPHIHWTITRHSFMSEKEPVSPYDYCSVEAQNLLWDLCQSYGKIPEDPL
ncbi:MAG: hypothetical protein H7645_06870 [Candidatus Heimdallarchaeota archaeon]|nr:hypothetical protein [Candidatus Heimdallarchaeota archaeon]MCK4770044.1 hypothetical protein [Candidatus Heimdallarchaeota archaeon]